MSTKPSRTLWITITSAAVMLAATLIFFGPETWTGQEMFFTNEGAIANRSVGSDLWHFNYPIRHFYAEELRRLRLPLWCPSAGPGVPLLAEGQVGALYPPSLVLFGLLPLPLAFNLSILLHLVLAGVFAALLAFRLGAGRYGSICSGILFGFSGFLVVHVKHFNLIEAAAWAPLVLYLTEGYARELRSRTAVILALVVAVTVFAGHPQMAYYNLVVAAIYGAYRAVTLARMEGPSRRAGGRRALHFVGGALGAVILGALLAAPQILPTARLNALGIRHEGVRFQSAGMSQLAPSHLITFVRPHHFGDPASFSNGPASSPGDAPLYDVQRTGNFFWEITGYVGIPALVLALAAIVLAGPRRRPLLAPVLVMLLPSLLLALGTQGGLAWLFYQVLPGFSYFRFYSRFLLYVDLALAVAAGIGLHLVLERTRLRAGWALLFAALATGACFGDLFRVLGDHNSRVPTKKWTQPPPSIRRILAEEASRDQPYRLVCADEEGKIFANSYYRAGGWKSHFEAYEPAWRMVHPNLNLLYDVPALGKYFSSLLPAWLHADLPWSLYNVRYVLSAYSESRPSTQRDSAGKEILETYGGDAFFGSRDRFEIRLLRNERAFPRAFLVPKATVRAGNVSRILRSPDFDPRREVLIDRMPEDGSLGQDDAPIDAPVVFRRYEPQRVHLSLLAPRDCWLFLSDTFYPEWECSIDGSPAPIYRANQAGRAVRVPEGAHEVLFRYRAGSLKSGLVLSAAGALFSCLWLLGARSLRKRSHRAGAASSP